ncbi:glycoside hydrolase N-terminal domain-containing protein [Paenibacillus solisilvae]|uniref:Glycoside hydrolase N-terminal domain-containing protein n=1 Tax=Paenibacillus solisilvae TaxID=2486751 RepID=A0ABW0W613_9BACL
MSDNDLTMWYRKPASEWVEALAVGNGRLGGMVFGGTGRERILLNEDTLWSGHPLRPEQP